MGINKYNGEGYSDPTAFEAIRHAEYFRVTHPTGYLEFNVERFFPCTVEKGKKVFKLIREYGSEEQKRELLALLLRKAKFYADTALQLDRRLDDPDLPEKEYADTFSQLKNARRQHERVTRNIEQLTGRKT